jgi:hydroxymethylpyrimidine pyrophosphatase-like HAD family hydrolase
MTLVEQQKEEFGKVLQKKFSACIVDIDGTLTVRGDEYIPAFLLPELAEIAMHVPMAVCTARSFQHAYDKLAPIFVRARNPEYCQANWLLICENGCLGYFFDRQEKKYKEFFREPYPYPEGHREGLFSKLKSKLQGQLDVAFMNQINFIFRPATKDSPQPDEITRRSHSIAEIVQTEVRLSDPKGLLVVGDSGIGVNVFPYYGNKERGIVELAKYIRDHMGLNIGPEAREVVVIGDQPGPLGNDEMFLSGKYGTPFTVGETHPEHLLPLPVFDGDKIQKGPEATIFLFHKLQFRNDLALH